MNIFSLHGKWFENNENRLTSNILFFLDQFRVELLVPFIQTFLPMINLSSKNLNRCRISFQVYDSGVIPDAEIILDSDTRILLESKIRSNIIGYDQIEEYCNRLKSTEVNYPNYYLLIITQTDQKSKISQFANEVEKKGIISSERILSCQWKDVINLFKDYNRSNIILKKLMEMFLEEVEKTVYNRIDIDSLPLSQLHEIVLTTQKPEFFDMALEDCVFWPYANFSPSQYVAYYFTKDCKNYGGTISHIARIKHIWHDVTIDEVFSSIPEFNNIPDFNRFKQRAERIYQQGDPTLFAIAITEKPVELRLPIPFKHQKGNKLHPNILPGRHTTMAKLLEARTLEDL